MLRCPECTENILRPFITTVLSTLTSVIKAHQTGDQPVFVQLFSGLPCSLSLNPSVPGACNKQAGESPCPWESERCI